MDEMQEKLGAILGNPQMMQSILSMAQSLGSSEQPPPITPEPPPSSASGIDPGMLQKLAGLAAQSGIDREQQALLDALKPYLSRERIRRLARAMRAAKTARLAGSVLGSGGLSF